MLYPSESGAVQRCGHMTRHSRTVFTKGPDGLVWGTVLRQPLYLHSNEIRLGEGGTESISIFQKAIVGFIAAFLTVTLAIPHQRRMLYPDSNRARNVAAIDADFRPRLSAGIFRFMS